MGATVAQVAASQGVAVASGPVASAVDAISFDGGEVRSGPDITGVSNKVIQMQPGRVRTDQGVGIEVVEVTTPLSATIVGSVVGPGGVGSAYSQPVSPSMFGVHLISGDGVAPALVITSPNVVAEDAVPDLTDASFDGYTRSKIVGLIYSNASGNVEPTWEEMIVTNVAPNVRRHYYMGRSETHAIPDDNQFSPTALVLSDLPLSNRRRRCGLHVIHTGAVGETVLIYNGDAVGATFTAQADFAVLRITAGPLSESDYGETWTDSTGVTVSRTNGQLATTSTADVHVRWFDAEFYH